MTESTLLTERERERKRRNEAIVKEFLKLNPQVMAQGKKPYRTICIIAEKYNMTAAGVRLILTNSGVYTTAKEIK